MKWRFLPFSLALVPAVVLADPGAGTGAGLKKVLILPFSPLHEMANGDLWIGKAVPQNVLIDLGRQRTVQPILYTETVADAHSAIRAGQMSNSAMVVFGSYEVVGDQIRITSEVVDVGSGFLLGTAKATGSTRDLLSLEDSVSDQVSKVVNREVALEQQQANAPAVAQAPVMQQPVMQQAPANPYYPYNPNSLSLDNAVTPNPNYLNSGDYGYYGGGYGYYGPAPLLSTYAYPAYPFYGSAFFFDNFCAPRFSFRHEDRDGRHGDWDGGWRGGGGHDGRWNGVGPPPAHNVYIPFNSGARGFVGSGGAVYGRSFGSPSVFSAGGGSGRTLGGSPVGVSSFGSAGSRGGGMHFGTPGMGRGVSSGSFGGGGMRGGGGGHR